uniref:Retroviral polymerase SH3-like domain-containing protein n=1 Tax=Strigamia maritima TaxID=126957 RepID=T1IKC7_STRMM
MIWMESKIAKRVNQTVHDDVRAILDETQLPDQLWAELALMFIYVKNRFPHSGINNQIPYILFRKRDLQLKHLKIPGSLAYVHVPTPRRESKHAPRAWKGVVVGYALSTRGYRVWDPSTDDVVESKHVEVDESRNWSEFESVNKDGKAIDKPELDKEEIYYDAETITGVSITCPSGRLSEKRKKLTGTFVRMISDKRTVGQTFF